MYTFCIYQLESQGRFRESEEVFLVQPHIMRGEIRRVAPTSESRENHCLS
jgi:hypothetical protein